jgi:hypothetical protein
MTVDAKQVQRIKSQRAWRPALMMVEAVDMNGEKPPAVDNSAAISYFTQRRDQVSVPIKTQTADVH